LDPSQSLNGSRAYRNDCRPRLADVFRIQVISNSQVRSPILTLGSTTFSHVKHENIYVTAVTKSNVNAALVRLFHVHTADVWLLRLLCSLVRFHWHHCVDTCRSSSSCIASYNWGRDILESLTRMQSKAISYSSMSCSTVD